MPAFGSQPGLPAFTAAKSQIFMDGKPIRLRGANWFGFEGANAVVDGLWERPMAEYVGFLASQGFNAVRVPLAMDNIANDPTVEYNMVKKDSFFNGIAHGRTSLEALDRLVGTARKPGSAQRAAAVVTRKVKETVGKARGRELVPTHDME